MPTTLPALLTYALGLPGAEPGVACVGTPLQRDTASVRRKAFVFVGSADVKVKLRESLDDATARAAADPRRYKVGAHGWATATFDPGDDVPVALLEGWIAESHALAGWER